MSDLDANDLRDAYCRRDDARFEELLKRNMASDFYRRMRMAKHVAHDLTGNAQAQLNWGDLFERLEFYTKRSGN